MGAEILQFPRGASEAPPRTLRQTRDLLEHLITKGSVKDLAHADPAWLRQPVPQPCLPAFYDEWGDGTVIIRGLEELFVLVEQLKRTSKAPAARAINARAWFEEWVELPQRQLWEEAPVSALSTQQGLEAAKALLRALIEAST